MNYSAQRGDTLGTIAQKFLGSSSKWREIWTANPGITDPNKIAVGQLIKIPGQSQAQTALVPVQSPVITSSIPMRDVTNSVPSSIIERLMQDKKMLMLLGIGLGFAIYLTMKKTKGVAA
jgi:LysM repeat protein